MTSPATVSPSLGVVDDGVAKEVDGTMSATAARHDKNRGSAGEGTIDGVALASSSRGVKKGGEGEKAWCEGRCARYEGCDFGACPNSVGVVLHL